MDPCIPPPIPLDKGYRETPGSSASSPLQVWGFISFPLQIPHFIPWHWQREDSDPQLLSSPSLPLSAFTPECQDQQEQLQMQNIRFSFCREFNAEPLIAAPRGAASVSSAMPCAISALISQQFLVYCKWSCTSVFIRSTQLRLQFVSACLSGGRTFSNQTVWRFKSLKTRRNGSFACVFPQTSKLFSCSFFFFFFFLNQIKKTLNFL